MNQFGDNDIQELKDMVRVGIVSNVNADKKTARVKIQDQGIVTGDLKIVQNTPTVKKGDCVLEPWVPSVGQWVVCLFKPDGEGDGFVLGGI